MKKLFLLLFICFLSGKGFSQTLTPSTYKQVYNFEPGDSLEYNFRVDDDNMYHDYTEGYNLYVITGVLQDSFSVNFQAYSIGISNSSNPFHTLYGGSVSFSYPLALADSSILVNLIHLDTLCDQRFDSVYSNQQFNGRKQNESSRMCFESNWEQKFADSLGQVSMSAHHTTGGPCAGESQSLIYYHKANGAIWGTPYYFLVMGINDVFEKTVYAQILPNSVKTTFQLRMIEPYHEEAMFKLYDAGGREVKQALISADITTFSRGELSSGIYFWQLETKSKVLDRGKLAFE